jgi:putative nucleotidyltransferase with HDIG domain
VGAPFIHMARSLKVYFGLVISGAALFAATLDWPTLQELSRLDWLGFSAFLSLAILAQGLAVDSTLGSSKPVKSSIAFLPLLALAVVMPVPAVVLAAGTVNLVHEVFFRDRSLPRTLFNVSQTILSYGLAAVVFQSLKPSIDPGASVLAHGLTSILLPFACLAVTFFVLNLLFVSIVLSIRQGTKLADVLTVAVGRSGGNLLYDLLASPVALFTAYLYESFFVGGLFAVVLPMLVIRQSYASIVDLQQANRDLLKVLVKAIETRDPYTSGHSMRVSTLATLIAKDYGIRGHAIENIETAALLHDIGKIDPLYVTIIAKPSDLTEHERRIIRTHATTGAELLQSLTSLDKEVIIGVRHHHEMYDGSGYPDGLSGKDIPLAARIIMICDAVDAMLSDRPYRNALSVDQVRDELRRCAGTQFDPELVDAILEHKTLERAEILVDRSGARAPAKAAAVAS